MQMKKKFLITFLLLFLFIGVLLGVRERNYAEQCIATTDSIQLDSSHILAQKLLGNDNYLSKFEIFIADEELFEDSVLKVYVTKEKKDLEESNILAELQFDTDQLKNGTLTCIFPEVKLDFNRDYYIVLVYEHPDQQGFIRFFTGSGISMSPVYDNEENYGVSLAYDMQYVTKNSSLFFVWKFIFIFGSYLLAYSIYRKTALTNITAVISLMVALLVYVAGIFDVLEYSYYVCFCIAFLCYVYVFIKVLLSSEDVIIAFYHEHMSYQIIGWLVLVLLCMIGNRGKSVIESDVVTHWGLATENIYMFDRLPVHAKSNLGLYRYPPLYPLFQYICMKIYGHWSESILFFAKDFLMMNVIISCCSCKKMKGLFGMGALLILGIGLPELFFDETVSYSLYADEILGIVFGYAVICLYRVLWNREKIKWELFIAIASLGLIKESGLVLSIILLFSALMIENVYSIIREHKITVEVKTVGTCLLAFVLAFASWQIYLKLHRGLVTSGASVTQNSITGVSGVSNNSLLDFFTGKAQDYKYDIIGIHLKKLLFDGYYNNGFLSVPFICWFAALCIAIYVLAKLYTNDVEKYKKNIMLLILTAGFYILFLHVVYTFTMSEREALMIASEPRYLGSFLVGVVLLFIYLVGNEIVPNFSNLNATIIYPIVLSGTVLVLTNNCYSFRQEIINREAIYDEYDTIRDDAVKLRKFLSEEDTVLYVADMETGGSYMYYNYDLLPIRSERYIFPTDENIWEPIYNLEVNELSDYFSGYEYVYLRITKNEFKEKYGKLFADPTGIECASLYRVGEDDLLYKVY